MLTGLATVFAAPACDGMASGGRIATTMGMDACEELPAQNIAAGQEFTFAVAVIEVGPGQCGLFRDRYLPA